MVSYKPDKTFHLGDGTVYFEGLCLSTDTKPTAGVANGSSLTEMDTGALNYYDAAGEQWVVPTPGS